MVDVGAGGRDAPLPGGPTHADPEVRIRGRLGIAVVDQGLSSAMNLLVTVVAARSVDANEFGVFGLLFLLYLLVIAAVRALVGEPALVRIPHPAGWKEDAFASGLLFAVFASLGLAGGAAVLASDQAAAAWVLAALLPGMVMQDLGRYVAFAERRPGRALGLDLTSGAVQVLALAGLAWTDRLTLVSIIMAWGASACLGGIQGLWLNGRIRPSPSFRWIKASWKYSWGYLRAFVATAGIFQITGLILGVVAGVRAVGAVRATLVLFGPVNVLYTAALAVVVPEAAQPGGRLAGALRRYVVISAGLAGAAVAVTVLGLTLPEEAGRFLLGETWPSARVLILPMGLVSLFTAVLAGADIGLRAARAVRESLQAQLRLSPIQLAVPILGGVAADAAGYTWGLAGVMGAAGIVMWHTLVRCGAEESTP